MGEVQSWGTVHPQTLQLKWLERYIIALLGSTCVLVDIGMSACNLIVGTKKLQSYMYMVCSTLTQQH